MDVKLTALYREMFYVSVTVWIILVLAYNIQTSDHVHCLITNSQSGKHTLYLVLCRR